jgi:predicted dehydrogenase
MSALRIAVVGTGGRAQTHLSTIKKLHDLYALCAVCDADATRAEENAAKWEAPGYADVRSLLDVERPDVVFIVVPPDAHHVIATLSAERGAHVITETPITTTLGMADAMIDACIRHGVKLEVSENVWRWPHERLKRMIVDAGLIGEVTHARLWYSSGSYHGFNAVRTLVRSEATRVSGYGGTVAVPAYTDAAGKHVGGQDWESGVVEFESGVTCLYEFPPRGHRNSLWEIEGTAGQLVGREVYVYDGANRVSHAIEDVVGEVDGRPTLDAVRLETHPEIEWGNPFRRYGLRDMDDISRAQILGGMHDAVTTGRDPEYGARNGRRDQELCIAVRESAMRDGSWVDVPLTGALLHEDRQHEEFRAQYGHDPSDVEALANVMFPRTGVRRTTGA